VRAGELAGSARNPDRAGAGKARAAYRPMPHPGGVESWYHIHHPRRAYRAGRSPGLGECADCVTES
jgi:hypothetical protein